MKTTISRGRRIVVTTLLLLFTKLAFSQVPTVTETDLSAIDWTPQTAVNLSELNALKKLDYSNQNFYVKLYVHVLRKSDGSDGASPEAINTMLQILYDDFDPLGIHFVRDRYAQIDYIDNDDYYSQPVDYASSIFSTNNHSDGIDIYVGDAIGSSDNGGGVQGGVGQSTGILIAGHINLDQKKYFSPFIYTKFISQLMGKVFYLYNTHFGTDGNPNGCAELVNGSNCANCGDYICDTPADPNISFNVAIGGIGNVCGYDVSPVPTDANGDPYDPDTFNIMSFSLFNCMTGFTAQQVTRMKNALGSLPHLQATQPTNYVYIRPQTDCYACNGSARSFRVYSNYNFNQLYIQNSSNISTSSSNTIGYINVQVNGLLSGEGAPGDFTIVRSGIGGSIGIIEATQPLWSGLPETIPDQTLSGPNVVSAGQGVGHILDERIKGIDFYNWQLPQPNVVVYGGEPISPDVWQYFSYNKYFKFTTGFAGNQTGLLTVYGENPCGLGDNGNDNEICVVNLDDPEGHTDCNVTAPIVYYPNPSNSRLQVDLSSQNKGLYEVIIYDKNQLPVISSKIKNEVGTFDVSGLADSHYYLHINDKDKTIVKAILMVKH